MRRGKAGIKKDAYIEIGPSVLRASPARTSPRWVTAEKSSWPRGRREYTGRAFCWYVDFSSAAEGNWKPSFASLVCFVHNRRLLRTLTGVASGGRERERERERERCNRTTAVSLDAARVYTRCLRFIIPLANFSGRDICDTKSSIDKRVLTYRSRVSVVQYSFESFCHQNED